MSDIVVSVVRTLSSTKTVSGLPRGPGMIFALQGIKVRQAHPEFISDVKNVKNPGLSYTCLM